MQRIVAYSVLSTQSDTQYVLVSLNYNPPGFDPKTVTSNLNDTSARVVISSPSKNFSFHDTLLLQTLHAFVSTTFCPKPGTAYALTVISSRYGTVSATSNIPASGQISIADDRLLFYPYGNEEKNIEIDSYLAPETRGFLVRFLVDFSLRSDTSVWGEMEIPLAYVSDSEGLTLPAYPKMRRAVTQNPIVNYPVATYLQALSELGLRYPSGINLKWAKFYLTQVDESLYSYYKVVNGFQDPYSIRMDQPDYTNIQNGLGVFGSFNVDSTIIRY